jgi:hypothetical protein
LRNSVPRLRIDQMMNFNWKFLVPMSILNLVVTAFLLQVIKQAGLGPADAGNFLQNIPQTLILLLGNGFVAYVMLSWARSKGRAARAADEAKKMNAATAASVAVGD